MKNDMDKFHVVSDNLSKKIREINKLAQIHHENMDKIDVNKSLSTNKIAYLTY
jgi:hypothetical protein